MVLLLAAFALRLQELTRQDIWWDEARNIDVALRPFGHIATAPELDIHPPVYFWLLHLWGRLAGATPSLDPLHLAFLMRFLSVWAGVLGVALLFALARRVGNREAAGMALFLAAVSPFWLAESQETRMYTVGFALLVAAALALLAATEPARLRPPGWRGWVPVGLYALFSALAFLTHYNAAFILVAWYVWWGLWTLLQERPRQEWRRLLGSGLASLILVAPVAPIALRQIPTYANPNLVVPTVAEYLWQNWQAYLGGYAFTPERLAGFGQLWLWGVLVLVGAGLTRLSWGGRHIPFLVFWLLGGLSLYYIAVLDRGAFNVRYSSFVTPALYVLMGLALARLGRLWRPLWPAVLLVLGVGLAAGVHGDLYDPRFAREDIRGVTAWLRETVQPGDVVFVDQKYPFGFYYGRYAIDPEVEPQGPEAAPARYLFVDINTVDQRLNRWAGDAERVFWVQWFESDTDPRRAVAFLLDKEGERAGEKWFQGYSIDWWRLTPPNHFELAPNLEPLQLRFSAAVETEAVSLPTRPLAPGDKIPVVLRWRRVPDGTVDRPLKARVALYDGEGARLAQNDQRLLNDRHLLPAEWAFTDRPLNVYMLEPPEIPPGRYELRLLVYDAETLEPLSLVDGAGNPLGLEGLLGVVTVE